MQPECHRSHITDNPGIGLSRWRIVPSIHANEITQMISQATNPSKMHASSSLPSAFLAQGIAYIFHRTERTA